MERVVCYLVEYLAGQLGHGGRAHRPLGLTVSEGEVVALPVGPLSFKSRDPELGQYLLDLTQRGAGHYLPRELLPTEPSQEASSGSVSLHA